MKFEFFSPPSDTVQIVSRARQWGGLKYQVEFWVVATVASSRGATEHNVE